MAELTVEIQTTTLNSFAAAAERKEKMYLADPSKGAPFRLDGRWQTFTLQDMRMEDLCQRRLPAILPATRQRRRSILFSPRGAQHSPSSTASPGA